MTRKILRQLLVKKCGLDPNFVIYVCKEDSCSIRIKQNSYCDVKKKLMENDFKVIPFDYSKYKNCDICFIDFKIPEKYRSKKKTKIDLEDDLIKKSIIEYNRKSE